MASFSESNFSKKLAELNATQQSIQTLSLWLIHHRKHAKSIVEVWMQELKKAKQAKKLTFLYLANDVIQNGKKKGPEFQKNFKTVLIDAYKNASKDADDKTRSSMNRMLNIWKERNVFDEEFVEKARIGMNRMAQLAKFKAQRAKVEAAKNGSPATPKNSAGNTPQGEPPVKHGIEEKSKKEQPTKKKKKTELSLREEIELEMKNGPGEPPEPEELTKALRNLEDSASSDATVRERIAALPAQVSDISQLSNLKDRAEAEKLSGQVTEACEMLANYNSRLATELQERKRVARMLRDFIAGQKEALVESEKKLQEYQAKHENVDSVRKELNSHLHSLPDLTLLPHLTAGLAPLPSAGDLFNLEKS